MVDYKLKNVQIETRSGILTVKGWVRQDYSWNGWAVPMFDKENADKIAEAVGLRYVPGTDTYLEPLEDLEASGYTEEEGMKWKGGYSDYVDEHVYDIGAMYWCWGEQEDEYNNMHEALKKFIKAADELQDNWDNEYPTVYKDKRYPEYMPGFDEFVMNMRHMILNENNNEERKALDSL